MEEIAVEFVYPRQQERPFHLKDDNVKIWVEVIIVTLQYAVATVNVLMANINDVSTLWITMESSSPLIK